MNRRTFLAVSAAPFASPLWAADAPARLPRDNLPSYRDAAGKLAAAATVAD